MPAGPGRDRGRALQRLVRILTALAQESPGWVNRDRLLPDLDYGPGPLESRRDALARDVRYLRELGWLIETADQGTDMRHRLVNQDPRLRTLLTDAQIRQLSRAVELSGQDPRTLGLPPPTTVAPPAPLLQPTLALELEEIIHAQHHRCLLSFTYRGALRQLHLDGVRRTGTGRWLITGREGDGTGEQKSYRVDRIAELRIGPPNSASPAQPVRKDPDPLTIADGTPVTAVVATAPEHEARVARDLGAPIDRRVGGDEVELTIPVVNRWLWRMRLYQLGTRVRLLGPRVLRDEVRRELEGFLVAP